MKNLIFRRLSIAALFITLVITGCATDGPTSPMSDGESFDTNGNASALGKKGGNAAVQAGGITTASHSFTLGDLVAGQNEVVGTVEVTNDGTYISVNYTVTGGWCLTEAHVYVGETPPSKAAPGQFNYNNDALSCVTSHDTGSINVDISGFAQVYIAVHGVVEGGEGEGSAVVDMAAMQQSWADPLVMEVTSQPGTGLAAYFDVLVSEWDALLDGTYLGWCVDALFHISRRTPYDAHAYSTYDPALPPNILDKPDNLDLVNYLLNQDLIGMGYTYGDIQRAIWLLVDNEISEGGLGPWTQENVDAILAMTVGQDGFIPTCDQVYGVIIVPFDSQKDPAAQPVIIPRPVPCTPGGGEGEETVWGFGSVNGTVDGPFHFFNRGGVQLGWGWWFEYDPNWDS